MKWATFTCIGKEPKKITKLFRKRPIRVAFGTRNTTENIAKPHPQIDRYEENGIYKMKCMYCPLKYVGQAGHMLYTRRKAHIEAVRNNNGNSGYSNHMLNTGHAFGSITDTMKVVKLKKKKNTPEKYHIYKMSKNGLQMNDANIEVYNPISEALQEVSAK
jgi:hypothetical protein